MEINETVAPIIDTTAEQKYVNFEVEKNGKKFIFCIPDGAAIGESYDVAHLVMQRLVELANDSMQKLKRPDVEPVVQPQGEGDGI